MHSNIPCRVCLMLLLLCWSLPVQAQIIDIVGSTTVKVLMEPAVDAYKQIQPDVIIHVGGGGSGVGAAAMIDDRASIGMMSREPEADEADRMQQRGIQRVRIAYDAIAVMVSGLLFHQYHIQALKVADIAEIYRGNIRNWQELGGPNRQIMVLDRVRHSGTHVTFANHVLGSGSQTIDPDAVTVESNTGIGTLLVASDQAIGYLPFGTVKNNRFHAVALIQNSQSYQANARNVLDGSYPLSRSLYVLYHKDAPAYVHAFIDYLQSAKAAPIIRRVGYIPVGAVSAK